jgi:hypothetical protein
MVFSELNDFSMLVICFLIIYQYKFKIIKLMKKIRRGLLMKVTLK